MGLEVQGFKTFVEKYLKDNTKAIKDLEEEMVWQYQEGYKEGYYEGVIDERNSHK